MNKIVSFGKNITEVINVKEKVNQLFKDKLVLVMLVLGLLTIVAAAGAVRIQKGRENRQESPYLEMDEPEHVIADGGTNETAAGDAKEPDPIQAKEAGTPKEAAVSETISYPAESAEENRAEVSAQEAGIAAEHSLALDFSAEETLLWPVAGNVLRGYSMETTVWFPTLEQYKCSPANVIQSDVSTPVAAPADARVLEIGVNEEIGTFVRLDFGNGYTAVCGQLKEIPVTENEYLYRGDIIGYIAEPTKYYSVEGTNLYFELQKDGAPIDALDYLE